MISALKERDHLAPTEGLGNKDAWEIRPFRTGYSSTLVPTTIIIQRKIAILISALKERDLIAPRPMTFGGQRKFKVKALKGRDHIARAEAWVTGMAGIKPCKGEMRTHELN